MENDDEFWDWVETLTDEQVEQLAYYWKQEEKHLEDRDFSL